MTTRIMFDFSRLATLSHTVTGSGVFNGTTEIGRARATIGTGDAATRVAASHLGSYGNALSYTVIAGGGNVERVERDQSSLRVFKRTGGTAAQTIAALTNPRDPRQFHQARQYDALTEALRSGRAFPTSNVQAFLDIGADLAGGDGSSAAAVGSSALTGGVDPDSWIPNTAGYTTEGDGGLFVFDSEEPLVLVQMMAVLAESAAWTLTLRRLTAARADASSAVAVAGATATSALKLDTPLVIPPGWGLGFTANTQGFVSVMVRRA